MTDRTHNDVPEEEAFLGLSERETHRRRVAAWVAAGGTFVVIIALWVMLLPTQLGGLSGFGFNALADWQSVSSDAAAQAPAFQASVQQAQRQLQAIDAQQQDDAQRAAAEQDAAKLRMKIETSASTNAAADADTDAVPTNQPNPKTP